MGSRGLVLLQFDVNWNIRPNNHDTRKQEWSANPSSYITHTLFHALCSCLNLEATRKSRQRQTVEACIDYLREHILISHYGKSRRQASLVCERAFDVSVPSAVRPSCLEINFSGTLFILTRAAYGFVCSQVMLADAPKASNASDSPCSMPLAADVSASCMLCTGRL